METRQLQNKSKKRKLTTKQKVFIAEYQKDWDGAKAAERSGYSPKTAAQIAYRLIHNSSVQEAIQAGVEKRLKKAGVEPERVLTELARIGLSDIRKIFKEDGSLKSPKDLDDETAPALASVEVEELFSGRGEERTHIGWTKKVKVFDKVRALEILGKHLKILNGDAGGESKSPVIFQTIIINKPDNSGTGEAE